MKYDCNKTLDYNHEWSRMCETMFDGTCDNCILKDTGISCYNTRYITQERIDIVQKWSDEHPEKTRKEVFLEMFPKADVRVIGIHNVCFGYLIGEECSDARRGEIGCEGCWDRPYNGEFEKARKEK